MWVRSMDDILVIVDLLPVLENAVAAWSSWGSRPGDAETPPERRRPRGRLPRGAGISHPGAHQRAAQARPLSRAIAPMIAKAMMMIQISQLMMLLSGESLRWAMYPAGPGDKHL